MQIKFVVFEALSEYERENAEEEISSLLRSGWQLADPTFRISSAGAYSQHHLVVIMLVKYG